jgi:steroid 5-alpha reductase family enzyme
LLTSLAAITGIMILLWLVSVALGDASIIDPFWGTGFVIVTAIACWHSAPLESRARLLLVLATIWGLRLSIYLLWRNWGHGEDRRYAVMRKKHGHRFWWLSLFTVFLLQGAILLFVSLPLQVTIALNRRNGQSWLDASGFLLWVIGFIFESVGDWQLARFQLDRANAGRVMDRGLWRYTRHPNYFGDFCVWWGLYLIAAAGGAWWTVLSPIAMSALLIPVSGVALLESTITDRRPEYAAYKARTSAFFPAAQKAG